MGQVNVNTPSGGEPAGSSSSGFVLGIIIAILVIAALVYFLVLAPPADNNGNGGNGGNGGDGGSVPAEGGESEAAPSGWVLTYHA